jgi:hypothetical protein
MTIRANWGRLAAITGAAVPALNILTAFIEYEVLIQSFEELVWRTNGFWIVLNCSRIGRCIAKDDTRVLSATCVDRA